MRVLIADDRSRSRDGLRALLATWPEVEVVGEAADGQEAVRLVEERQAKVVVLTMYASYRADALAAGADAFLVKGCPAGELLGAILDY
jgi:DNA-binding NarL/FixJ family response regulator